ncbi:MAG: hypothetical protein V4739_14280 [Pseudomonadota bacterium]
MQVETLDSITGTTLRREDGASDNGRSTAVRVLFESLRQTSAADTPASVPLDPGSPIDPGPFDQYTRLRPLTHGVGGGRNGYSSLHQFFRPDGKPNPRLKFDPDNPADSVQARWTVRDAAQRHGFTLSEPEEGLLADTFTQQYAKNGLYAAALVARYKHTRNLDSDTRAYAARMVELGMPEDLAVAFASRLTPPELQDDAFMEKLALAASLVNAPGLDTAEQKADAVLKVLRDPNATFTGLVQPNALAGFHPDDPADPAAVAQRLQEVVNEVPGFQGMLTPDQIAHAAEEAGLTQGEIASTPYGAAFVRAFVARLAQFPHSAATGHFNRGQMESARAYAALAARLGISEEALPAVARTMGPEVLEDLSRRLLPAPNPDTQSRAA